MIGLESSNVCKICLIRVGELQKRGKSVLDKNIRELKDENQEVGVECVVTMIK